MRNAAAALSNSTGRPNRRKNRKRENMTAPLLNGPRRSEAFNQNFAAAAAAVSFRMLELNGNSHYDFLKSGEGRGEGLNRRQIPGRPYVQAGPVVHFDGS